VTIAERIASWRVTLGFAAAIVVFWLARPTARSLAIGSLVALAGEALRIWAAGHVEKNREVTRSGPYRLTRHPLYLGSSLIGAGIAMAAANGWAALLIGAYLAVAIGAAIRAEEAHLRRLFGAEYDAYAARTAPPMPRRFSVRRALDNREHHALAGLAAALLLLALKANASIR
jgi:protein-S-isoprenylcysteine O-methyltransferase Ste14